MTSSRSYFWANGMASGGHGSFEIRKGDNTNTGNIELSVWLLCELTAVRNRRRTGWLRYVRALGLLPFVHSLELLGLRLLRRSFVA